MHDAQVACQHLVHAFAHHLDHRRFNEAAELFTEDAAWERHGHVFNGPSEIRAAIEQRSPSVVERHVITTTMVERLTETECSAVSYAMIFRGERRDSDGVITSGPATVGDLHDKFRLTERGWRFTHRTSQLIFRPQPSVEAPTGTPSLNR